MERLLGRGGACKLGINERVEKVGHFQRCVADRRKKRSDWESDINVLFKMKATVRSSSDAQAPGFDFKLRSVVLREHGTELF